MFLVRCVSPLDDKWEERDVLIKKAAGAQPDFSGTEKKDREHGWNIKDFERAVAMKNRLNRVDQVKATVREAITDEHGGKKKRG